MQKKHFEQSHVWYGHDYKSFNDREFVAFYLSVSSLNFQFSVLWTLLYVGFPAERKHLSTNSEGENNPGQSIHCLIVPSHFK